MATLTVDNLKVIANADTTTACESDINIVRAAIVTLSAVASIRYAIKHDIDVIVNDSDALTIAVHALFDVAANKTTTGDDVRGDVVHALRSTASDYASCTPVRLVRAASERRSLKYMNLWDTMLDTVAYVATWHASIIETYCKDAIYYLMHAADYIGN